MHTSGSSAALQHTATAPTSSLGHLKIRPTKKTLAPGPNGDKGRTTHANRPQSRVQPRGARPGYRRRGWRARQDASTQTQAASTRNHTSRKHKERTRAHAERGDARKWKIPHLGSKTTIRASHSNEAQSSRYLRLLAVLALIAPTLVRHIPPSTQLTHLYGFGARTMGVGRILSTMEHVHCMSTAIILGPAWQGRLGNHQVHPKDANRMGTGPGDRRRGGTHGGASPQQRVQPPGAPTSVKKGQPQHGIWAVMTTQTKGNRIKPRRGAKGRARKNTPRTTSPPWTLTTRALCFWS
jgi:hypothetical protein